MSVLSELDHTVLGVVLKFGPMSPYAVRRHFAESPLPRFSSSTGSIYPALARLEGHGLVTSTASARGRQARSLVSATDAGHAALRAWFDAAPERDEADPPPDALRTRLYFVGLLPREEQERFFEETLAAMRERLRSWEAYVEGFGSTGPDAVSRAAARGAVHVQRARIRWLTEARGALESS